MKQKHNHRSTGAGWVPRRGPLNALAAATVALFIVFAAWVPAATAGQDAPAPADYRVGAEDVLVPAA